MTRERAVKRTAIAAAAIALLLMALPPSGAAVPDYLGTALEAISRGPAELRLTGEELSSLGPAEAGFTDVIPADVARGFLVSERADGGISSRADGVNISLWRTAPLPPEGRRFLNWHFECDAEIAEGTGRAGLIFGVTEPLNLLSVELSSYGEIRLVSWGMTPDGPLGRIVWSGAAGRPGRKPFRLTADYDMRAGVLTCSADGGKRHEIKLASVMPSGPMTIRAAGVFAAVEEARRVFRDRDIDDEYDIDMSRKYVRAIHRRLVAEGGR